MDKRVVIILLIVISIIFIIFGFSKINKKTTASNIELNYNKVTDEKTRDTYYQIYDKQNGRVIKNVTDEASIQMYLDNPDFVGPKVESNSAEESVWESPEISE